MSQIIRLNESDLLNIVKRVLLEGKEDNPEKRVKSAYKLMIDGAEGVGTNPKYIINGIKKLKNKEEFYRLNYLFKDNKTGYKSFNEMIKGEFGYGKIGSNENEYKQLSSLFEKLGLDYLTNSDRSRGFVFNNMGKGNIPIVDDETSKIGCIEGNCKDGIGVYKDKKGNIFRGTFEKSLPKHGELSGMYYDEKVIYKGDFKNGVFYYGDRITNTDTITGHFKLVDDWYEPSGYGHAKYKNDDEYKGNFVDGFKTGFGKYIEPNGGAEFIGEFKDDLPLNVKFKTKNGCTYINGTWDGWVMNGEDWYVWDDKPCTKGEIIDLSKQNNNNNNNQNTTTCDQPQKPLYKYKDDKMYEYVKSGDCWWAQNVKSKKWFNLTELVKTRPNIQVSIDRLNTAETNNELIMITGS